MAMTFRNARCSVRFSSVRVFLKNGRIFTEAVRENPDAEAVMIGANQALAYFILDMDDQDFLLEIGHSPGSETEYRNPGYWALPSASGWVNQLGTYSDLSVADLTRNRRGNDRVMLRGTFANIRIRNFLAPGTEGGVTRYFPLVQKGMAPRPNGKPEVKTISFGSAPMIWATWARAFSTASSAAQP